MLPVDPSLSIAKYSNIVGTTFADATAFEGRGDPESGERAALLYIRILQIVCKTIPSHPEYSIPENEAIVASLSRRADSCFARLESYAASLSKARSAPAPSAPLIRPPEEIIRSSSSASPPSGSVTVRKQGVHPASLELRLRSLHIPSDLVELLERIASDTLSRGLEFVGALAGREVQPLGQQGRQQTQDPGAPDVSSDVGRDAILHATALVIPAQKAMDGNKETVVNYLDDLASLLAAKSLLHLGWIRVRPAPIAPNGLLLGRDGAHLHAAVHSRLPEAITGFVMRDHDNAVDKLLWLSLLGSRAERSREDVHGPTGISGDIKGLQSGSSGKTPGKTPSPLPPGMVGANHVVFRTDSGAPPFKLYDLRPMAKVHEKQTDS